MIKLHLYWKHDGEDVDLGVAYYPLLPPPGALLVHTARHRQYPVVWRVLFPYLNLIQEGSADHRTWVAGAGRVVEQWAHLFVEPADGPFEP